MIEAYPVASPGSSPLRGLGLADCHEWQAQDALGRPIRVPADS
jgi:hypothetical protein